MTERPLARKPGERWVERREAARRGRYLPLPERWRRTIPGERDHRFFADQRSRALYVGDGGLMPAALRLRRLDVDTGAELASTRTRGQLVFGMAFRGDRLFAASNSRLFELDSTGLSVIRQWDKRLVRWS